MPRKNDDTPQFEPVQPRLTNIVTDMLDEFYGLMKMQGVEWSDSTILKAAGMDHQFLTRIRKGESFTTSKVEQLRETINAALRGKILPEQFRPSARKGGTPARRKAA